HLVGGLVGEGDGQDRERVDVVVADEVGDAVGQDARLPRPGSGHDEDGAVGGRHRLALDRVEVVEKRARVAHGLTEYPPRRPSSRGSATTRADGRSARVTSPRIVDSGGAGVHTVKASAVRPDNNRCMEPVKVVVAGPAGAGKSTLVRTIADMTVRSTDP